MVPPDNDGLGANENLNKKRPAGSSPLTGTLMAENESDSSRTAAPIQLDPIALLRAFRRRWVLATCVGSVLACIAGTGMWVALSYMMKPKFTAYALLGVSAGPRKILFQTGESDTGTYSSLNTHVLLIRSQFVLNAALRQPGIMQLQTIREQSDPIAWLEKNIQVSFPAQSEVLRIAITGEHPTDLAEIVNAVKQAYIDEVGNAEQTRRVQRLSNLERIRGELDSSIKAKKTMLEEMAKGVGSGDPKTLNSKQQFAMQMHAQLLGELLKAKSDLNKLQVQAEAEKTIGEPEKPADLGISESLIDRHIESHPQVRTLQLEISRQQAKVDKTAVALRPGTENTALKAEQRTLESLKTSLSDLRERLRPEITADLAEQTRAATQSAGSQTARQIVMLVEQVNNLEQQWENQSKVVADIGKSSFEIEQLRKDIDEVDHTTASFAAEIGKLKIELQAPPRITDLQKAEVPKSEDLGPRNRKVSMAAFAGFCLGIFVISFLEFRSHRVETPREVESSLGLRIMGSLPDLPTRAISGPNGSTKSYWLSLLSESIDNIRTTLLSDAHRRSMRVIMVTSAVGHEGKTTLATHLASSLARAGRRTILLDCDLRRPAVHKLFDLAPQPGFSDVIGKTSDLLEAVRPTHLPDLFILPAGPAQRGTSQSLTNGAIAGLFEQLREEYDFVVIDSAPILPVADSLIIAQYTDGVILSVLRGASQLHRVWAAQSRLAMLGIEVIGAVVNRVRGDVYGYGGYYHYQPIAAAESAET